MAIAFNKADMDHFLNATGSQGQGSVSRAFAQAKDKPANANAKPETAMPRSDSSAFLRHYTI